MLRVIVAGVVGGIAMFIWSAIAHIATPLGAVGRRRIARKTTIAKPTTKTTIANLAIFCQRMVISAILNAEC